jgi:hypothetical protein
LYYVGNSLLEGGIIQSLNWFGEMDHSLSESREVAEVKSTVGMKVERNKDNEEENNGFEARLPGENLSQDELEVWHQQFAKADKADDVAIPLFRLTCGMKEFGDHQHIVRFNWVDSRIGMPRARWKLCGVGCCGGGIRTFYKAYYLILERSLSRSGGLIKERMPIKICLRT